MEKQSMKKRILNILFYTISSILFIFIALEVVAPNKTMDILGFKGFAVLTPSMVPVYNVGDVIITTKVDLDDLKVGDPITFRTDLNNDGRKEMVTHYIFSIEVVDGIRTYETVPEGRNYADPWTLYDEDIVGIVSFKIPWVGFIIIFALILLENPIFLGLIIVNVIIVVIIIKLIKKKPEDKHNAVE
ncbi:MAG: signal peptidase I [Acholeplasmataceae bacterium]|nr:signal peptidase I [Acholeplasmataceae bacterium]